jgi:hypothetical protein
MVAEYPTPLVEALLAIIDAARAYLLPDGIGKGAFITKVLRVNVCDFYLFQGRPGFTVMAMTVNPDAGQSAPDTFRDEGLYVFRFDLNGDAREDISLKVRFGAVLHADDQDRTHVQSFEVRRVRTDRLIGSGWRPHCSRAYQARGRDDDRGGGFRWPGSGSLRGETPRPGANSGPLCLRKRGSIRACFKAEEFLRGSKRLRAGARGAHSPDRTRSRAWLGDSIALRPRTGDSGFPMGVTANHERLHAGPNHARGFQQQHSGRGYLAFLRSDRQRRGQTRNARCAFIDWA